ncbi:Poly(A) RNA polymerase protein cid1 [Tolypocladium ophioglossoides CBS 100239]|uniref:polynucleotide adenylyltransferase n=1 Tax=Tolypocladium ophioglossoides (strain CBS 100239) TaxID=1163406 RepID=A0A0L0NBB8_TOLOC|nr:Poly(A) RNA polymerase protein cid1 [Tolypocladium ophioglossoides CBS 100239]
MASNKADPFGASGDGSPVGLESHLRSLILTNAAGNGSSSGESTQRPAQQAQPPRATQDTRTGNDMSAGDPKQGPQGPQGPRASRRRPNQAERRQMNSQLSVPIDPRPQSPPHQANLGIGSHGHASRPPRPDPRYAHAAAAHSSAMAWAGHAGSPDGNTSWNNSAPSHAGNLPWNPHFRQHGRRDPPPFQHDPSSPQASRYGYGPPQNQRQLFFRPEEMASQAHFLDRLCYQVVSSSEIDRSEIADKEAFRQRIESICRDVLSRHEQESAALDFPPLSVELKCFGSLSSGFATKASDMDLGLLSPLSQIRPDAAGSPIPRLVEKAFLDAGLGARLLSRTRVPIIKLCENPPESLHRALVAARERWESGTENDAREVADDDEENEQDTTSQGNYDEQADSKKTDADAKKTDADAKKTDADSEKTGANSKKTGADSKKTGANSKKTGANPSSLTEFEVPCGDGGETKRFQLQQGPNHTLSTYYGLAKRVLRRAGGRDVTPSNYREFTALDWTVLNSVCQAFVQGLYDPQIRKRLAAYPSLAFEPLYNMPSNRSLAGVFTQVDGEQALQTWDTWPARDAIYDFQPQAEQALLAWKDIQWKRNFGIDPISYTKDLQLTLDKVKRIPSVQLVVLKQGPQETPSQYCARAKGVRNNLRSGLDELSGAAQQQFIAQYISGIAQDDVRDMMEAVVGQPDSQLAFEAVSQRHKCLHLSLDLDRALRKGMYDAAHATDIAEYIRLLRSPLREVATGPLDCDFFIPVPPGSSDLISRVKKLQDPRKMAPNQPRDKYRDPLEFPTTGAGIQCDINFSPHLVLHNTALLRCYSHADPRVRPMVLFIKHWAKVRGINSGYRGTLSSYGYVLMVLHYLVNVAQPFVCPNLQQLAPLPPPDLSPAEVDSTIRCRGYDVQFWRNENEIVHLAATNQLNYNTESIGHLLRGFFEYFAEGGMLSNGQGKGFGWGRDVLSLRTQGGLLSKQEKGWIGAKTVFEVQGIDVISNPQAKRAPTQPPLAQPVAAGHDDQPSPAQAPTRGREVKEIRHRYLFAIEDPFELDHNVARTVTHNGIVSIRDEFRRAWRIIRTAEGANTREDLLQDVKEVQESGNSFMKLLDDIHGPRGFWGVVQ